MSIPLCCLIGYLLGCINPAALISGIKKCKLRDNGTGNLGATNVALLIGKRYGAAVMLFDIFKAFFAYKCAEALFAKTAYVGLVAAVSSVVGHCFPFYLDFKGGKGLAAFGGLVLAHDPLIFFILLGVALALMLAVNYSFVVPYTGGLFFPILAYLRSGSAAVFALTAASGVLIMCMHLGNAVKALKLSDITVSAFCKSVIKKNASDVSSERNDITE